MSQITLASTLFFSLLLTSLPFLLAGIAVSSLLRVSVDGRRLATFFPRDRVVGAIAGSLLGLLLPVGQYGTVPIARLFFERDVPRAVIFSFLVAAPTWNIPTLLLTWQTFADRPEIIFFRSLWIGVMAFSIGILFSYYRERHGKKFADDTSYLQKSLPRAGRSPRRTEADALVQDDKLREYPRPSFFAPLSLFTGNFCRETLEFAGPLVSGCAIASLFQLWLPQQQLLVGEQTPFPQILVMVLFGFGLSVNSILSAFVPGSLTTDLFSGSLLAYLLFGSLVNPPGLGLLLVAFPVKLVFYLVVLSLLFTLLASMTFSYYLA